MIAVCSWKKLVLSCHSCFTLYIYYTDNTKKQLKKQRPTRARLWIPIFFLFQLNKAIKEVLLTYLAITTCYRSWPQLISGAIHHQLLQLSANFNYPAFLDFHQTVWSNAGEAILVYDFHHQAQIRRLYELGWSYPYDRHEPAIEDVVF